MIRQRHRPRTRSGPSAHSVWRDKPHPFFLRGADFNKRVIQLSNSGSPDHRLEIEHLRREVLPELNSLAEKLHDEMNPKGLLRHNALMKVFGVQGYPPGTAITEGHLTFHWLRWFKFGITVGQLVHDYQAGNLKAIKQVHKPNLEYDKWRFGLLDPNKLKFKMDLDHFDLMTLGLDLGLERLGPE
jgi:hypothetical protein